MTPPTKNPARLTTSIAVPCYNEAARLQADRLLSLLDDVDQILFVDDGSSDATQTILRDIAAAHRPRVGVLRLEKNLGKAEAVRRGLTAMIHDGAGVVGYLDADLSTPPEELLAMLRAFRDIEVEVLIASRVKLLGRDIRRHESRHYLGRVFATLASLILRLPVYDTQCGAKLFRVSPNLEAALAEPFLSRWAFDVELIGRLMSGQIPFAAGDFVEYPLGRWIHVKGSKLGVGAMLGAGLDLGRIYLDLSRRRR